MGFEKHERCDGDVQGVGWDEESAECGLEEWYGGSGRRGRVGGVEGW